MAQDADRLIARLFTGRTTTGQTAALECGGRVNLSWQFWGEDGAGAQANFTTVSIQLEGRCDDDAPWVVIGTADTSVGGQLVLNAYPINLKAVRINCTSLTLGSASTLEAVVVLN